jgi:hypothetical protein
MTPGLELQIGKLWVMFEFVEVATGSLSIIHANDTVVQNQHHQSVDIADIPTDSEMQLNCPDGSNELIIQLQDNRKVGICITFIWDNAHCLAVAAGSSKGL